MEKSGDKIFLMQRHDEISPQRKFFVRKKPMDLTTVEKKLRGNQYANAHEFFDDLLLIFKNAIEYNDDPTVTLKKSSSAPIFVAARQNS